MQQVINKYKVVRRGQKYCVRVKGTVNTTHSWHWCRERNMTYSNIKQPWLTNRRDRLRGLVKECWDYDFIFNKKEEALTFVLGYL